MSFTDTQLDALKAPLNRQNVRSRQQAGRSLSYIEGWLAIAEANRIFGFDAWNRETVELRECGEPRQTGDKWRVAFICRVRVTVQAGGRTIIRDGTGYGSGIDKDLGQAFESAVKEAETDAMKRGLMTFGNPFGLALYDKDQANVVDVPTGPPPMTVEHMLHEISEVKNRSELADLKEDAAFRAGYRAADELSRKRIQQALAKAAEEAAA